ncbi:eukaryotic translation initiation factor 2B [Tieghemostelium lacteum]|uniref:Translation initiation factor eIF2B subunit gamma n=1 Tax=Tieghemostelium lacteum TaxID=361077 RepID=A0A151ZCR1_TIELA|nr:eukaryotic translation initiation factor 2B [Tieghemostelium lacteum]|eukprot:KYQ91742.1 eukaryotic translation initiation factor 2B [Tieghemostelium lacteum]
MSVYASEFQVVIVATDRGTGIHRLSPIDEKLPHSLLPVANRPLISYQLELLEKVGFKTNKSPVIAIVSENSHAKIRQYVSEIYKDKIEVDFVVIKENISTCEMLFKIKDKIKSNYFIFMNNNLIVDDSFLTQMTDLHRINDSSLTVLLRPKDPKVKSTENLFTDYIALDESKQRIIMMESATELEDDVIVTKTLLKNFPNLTIYNNLQDTQFYIFSRWVLDLISEDQKNKYPQFFDVKKQLIPYLLKCQIPGAVKTPLPESAINNTQELAKSISSTASPFNSKNILDISGKKAATVKCFAYMFNSEKGYCMNVNTIASYQQVNRDITRGETMFQPYEDKDPIKNNYIDPTAKVTPTAVGPECIIGESTTFGDRCSIKVSVIGKHCKIGPNVRIENSIIMDHVTIDEQCKISSSIIGNDVDIKKGCEIKESKIASGTTVSDKQTFKKSIGANVAN